MLAYLISADSAVNESVCSFFIDASFDLNLSTVDSLKSA